MSNLTLAFLLTLIAGLSTGIGSLIAFFAKKTNTNFLSIALGFSAGVMIYVSMMELLTSSIAGLGQIYGSKTGNLIGIGGFFGGMAIMAIIDKVLPEEKNPHSGILSGPLDQDLEGKKSLMRTGKFTALAIAIHNFPEGLATFVSALQDPSIAIPIVVAIAIHNIPEGIAVSVPIYYATGNRKKAFWYSFASGLSEPLGAIIGYLALMRFMDPALNNILFAAVGGIMVFISFDELLPAAREYDSLHLSIYGLIGGMILMALSLWMFL